MRTILKLALVAGVAVAVLPTSSANAIVCTEPLTAACQALCEVHRVLDRPCPR
jgi:hypothetical protein